MAAAATADCRPGRVPPWKDRRPAAEGTEVDTGNAAADHDLWPKVAARVCAEGQPVVVLAVTSTPDDSEHALENNVWLRLAPSPDADSDGRGRRRRRQYPDAAERQSRDCIGLAGGGFVNNE